ncbi:TolC family protein [Mucilaginibacter paludis]|uniref:Outer membrane efflux protein n=1 Tax=Mucilaginibacter paludis DSM 18603 TaxID=714943 RepID=H1Y5V1_9SPHI|nr:TolC family protein [Mucilaginibacter paludis]EHQ30373.1 outer membrane efflux protein [Mucilaginibacter paludis DSM 18603]
MRISLKYIAFIIFLSAAIYVGPSHAQDTSATHLPQSWDLKTCIEYAKNNNITINSLKLDVKTAGQNLLAAKTARYPSLSASVSQGVVNYKSGAQASSGYGANADLTIFNGGYLNNDIKSKTLSEQTANLSVETTTNDITLQITQAYLNILLAKENIVYLADLVTSSEAQVNQGQQRLAAGTIAQKDLLQLRATLANDKYTLVTAQNQLQQNTLTLKQLLQLPTSASFNVIASDTSRAANLMNLNTAQQKALAIRPEIKSAMLNIQLQQTELEKARATIRPTLSLGGALYSGYNSSTTGSYYSQLNNGFYQSLGLTLSIPIFDKKVTRTNVAKAKIEVQQAGLTLMDERLTLTQAVEKAYLNVQNANSQYSAAAEQFTYTKEALRISAEQLRIGSNNIVEYLQQKNLYVQALQAFVQAKYSANLYSKIYNFYTGIPVTE